MAARRIRRERDYERALADVIWRWERKQGVNLWFGWYTHRVKDPVRFQKEIEDRIFAILKTRYEKRLEERRATLQEIENAIWEDSQFDGVGDRLWSMLDVWERAYPTEKKSELQTLVNDGQNVHTRIVIKQTDRSMALLDATPVPKGQRTVDEILEAWMTTRSWATCKEVYEDLTHWGKKATIYVDDDYLYRKTLRSLWALIKSYKSKGEIYDALVDRLWEECSESVGVCAQGHISRLANVMVGFHEEFLSPRSSKEAFQDRMAEIGRETWTVEMKIATARQVMEQYGLPEEEREAWLEAF
jgi:hypothetical protein